MSAARRPRQPEPMPDHHPRIAHFLPYLIGDSLGSIGRAAVLGFPWIDQNVHSTKDLVAYVLHWRKFRRQFAYYWTGRYVGRGRLRREERKRVPWWWPHNFDHLTSAQASRLRSAPIGGKRPRRAVAHMERARQRKIKWAGEAKNSKGLNERAFWERLAEEAVRTDVVMAVMVLTSWANWRTIVRHAHAVGFAVAVLPRTPKPDDWPEFKALGIQVWGRWR